MATMTSKVDLAISDGTKLPPIVSGCGHLVSSAPSLKSDTESPKHAATNWAAEVRKR